MVFLKGECLAIVTPPEEECSTLGAEETSTELEETDELLYRGEISCIDVVSPYYLKDRELSL